MIYDKYFYDPAYLTFVFDPFNVTEEKFNNLLFIPRVFTEKIQFYYKNPKSDDTQEDIQKYSFIATNSGILAMLCFLPAMGTLGSIFGLFTGIIELLKYIDINYPLNVYENIFSLFGYFLKTNLFGKFQFSESIKEKVSLPETF